MHCDDSPGSRLTSDSQQKHLAIQRQFITMYGAEGEQILAGRFSNTLIVKVSLALTRATPNRDLSAAGQRQGCLYSREGLNVM